MAHTMAGQMVARWVLQMDATMELPSAAHLAHCWGLHWGDTKVVPTGCTKVETLVVHSVQWTAFHSVDQSVVSMAVRWAVQLVIRRAHLMAQRWVLPRAGQKAAQMAHTMAGQMVARWVLQMDATKELPSAAHSAHCWGLRWGDTKVVPTGCTKVETLVVHSVPLKAFHSVDQSVESMAVRWAVQLVIRRVHLMAAQMAHTMAGQMVARWVLQMDATKELPSAAHSAHCWGLHWGDTKVVPTGCTKVETLVVHSVQWTVFHSVDQSVVSMAVRWAVQLVIRRAHLMAQRWVLPRAGQKAAQMAHTMAGQMVARWVLQMDATKELPSAAHSAHCWGLRWGDTKVVPTGCTKVETLVVHSVQRTAFHSVDQSVESMAVRWAVQLVIRRAHLMAQRWVLLRAGQKAAQMAHTMAGQMVARWVLQMDATKELPSAAHSAHCWGLHWGDTKVVPTGCTKVETLVVHSVQWTAFHSVDQSVVSMAVRWAVQLVIRRAHLMAQRWVLLRAGQKAAQMAHTMAGQMVARWVLQMDATKELPSAAHSAHCWGLHWGDTKVVPTGCTKVETLVVHSVQRTAFHSVDQSVVSMAVRWAVQLVIRRAHLMAQRWVLLRAGQKAAQMAHTMAGQMVARWVLQMDTTKELPSAAHSAHCWGLHWGDTKVVPTGCTKVETLVVRLAVHLVFLRASQMARQWVGWLVEVMAVQMGLTRACWMVLLSVNLMVVMLAEH